MGGAEGEKAKEGGRRAEGLIQIEMESMKNLEDPPIETSYSLKSTSTVNIHTFRESRSGGEMFSPNLDEPFFFLGSELLLKEIFLTKK